MMHSSPGPFFTAILPCDEKEAQEKAVLEVPSCSQGPDVLFRRYLHGAPTLGVHRDSW